jgi:hypothetical protein
LPFPDLGFRNEVETLALGEPGQLSVLAQLLPHLVGEGDMIT